LSSPIRSQNYFTCQASWRGSDVRELESKMSRHTLYAYVEGSDLHEVAELLSERFAEFVASRDWICPDAWTVDQHQGDDDPSLRPGDLPHWELGINVELPDPGQERRGWFGDIEAIALFLGALPKATGRGFVVGIADSTTGVADDLFFVRSADPDLNRLRQIIGVGGIE